MKRAILGFAIAVAAAGSLPGIALAAEPNELFMIRMSARTTDEVVAAIKGYVKKKDWVYVNDASLKGVTMVKFCVPAMAKDIFAAGDFVAAMLPCGQIGLYSKGGGTEISMLHPEYMYRLLPDPSIRKAADKGAPLFKEMLDEIAK